MPTISQVARVCGCDVEDISNLIRRDRIMSNLPETTPGVAREFSRENVREIAFHTALVRVGVEWPEVGVVVKQWLDRAKAGNLGFVYWNARHRITDAGAQVSSAVERDADELAAVEFDDAPAGYVGEPRHAPSPLIVRFDLGSIVADADFAFEGEGE